MVRPYGFEPYYEDWELHYVWFPRRHNGKWIWREIMWRQPYHGAEVTSYSYMTQKEYLIHKLKS